MSIFAWLTRPFQKPQPPARAPQAAKATPSAQAPAAATSATPAPATASGRGERNQRRELLYTVVRDTMVRAGVLSAGYKFKVLSLDQRGDQFLVMIDVAQEYGSDSLRLSEIESQITRMAKARFSIAVTAVYWRIQRLEAPLVAGVAQQRPTTQAPVATPAAALSPMASGAAPAPAPARMPAPVRAPLTAPAAVPVARPGAVATAATAATVPVAAAHPALSDKHVSDEEMRAFEQALASVSSAARSTVAPTPTPGVAVRSGPRQAPPPALTGFEDTILPEPQDTRPSDLGATQYGDLK